MTLAAETGIPVIPSVSEIAAGYDAWLCDIWGVIHNGESAFAAAAAACRAFRERGGTVILITNAPRPAESVARQLARMGVDERAWDRIVTSGDITRGLLRENRDKSVFHLGPDRDKSIFDGAEPAFAGPEDAELVVCSGLYDDDTETPDDYAGLLEGLAKRKPPMICANPDIMVERGERLVYCAGALADVYEDLGGSVTYTGKPHPPIYERAIEVIAELRGAPVARERILAIGDGLKTDMAGAARAGLDALFVASGLHLSGGEGAAPDAAAIAGLFAQSDMRPVAAQSRLAW